MTASSSCTSPTTVRRSRSAHRTARCGTRMTEAEPTSDLVGRVSVSIEETHAFVASQDKAALTLIIRHIENLLATEVFGTQRAGYAEEIVAAQSHLLGKCCGGGIGKSRRYRMARISRKIPDRDSAATLEQQLSWSYFKVLPPLYSDEARGFYIQETHNAWLRVRARRELIGRQGFERCEIAKAYTAGGSAVSLDTCSDRYFLYLFGVKDAYSERDRKSALILQMEIFFLDVDNGRAIEVGSRSKCLKCTWAAPLSPRFGRRRHRQKSWSNGSRKSIALRKNKPRATHLVGRATKRTRRTNE